MTPESAPWPYFFAAATDLFCRWGGEQFLAVPGMSRFTWPFRV